MSEFRATFPDEIDQLSPEQIAERTGYSAGTVRSYLKQEQINQIRKEKEQEREQRRMQEANAYTYVTPSGNTFVLLSHYR